MDRRFVKALGGLGLAAVLAVPVGTRIVPLVFAHADAQVSTPQNPDDRQYKKNAEAQEKRIHARDVALGPAPPTKAGSETTPSSCPTPVTPGPVEAFSPGEAQFLGGKSLTTQVVISRGGVGYVVYAGAADEDSQQGIVVVHRLAPDLCADPSDAGSVSTYNDTTGRNGPLTILSAVGESIRFRRSSGQEGAFDLGTAAFRG